MFSGRLILTLATITLLCGASGSRAQDTPPQTTAAETAPVLACIAQAARSATAGIAIRSTDPATDRILSKPSDASIAIDAPVTFFIDKPAASTACKYVYAISRAGQVVVSSEKPLSIVRSQIKLQHRTDTRQGLRSGPISLWIWGVDPEGRVSSPTKLSLTIAGQD